MRVTAYSIILFFVSLNVSLYLIAETQVLPYYQQPYVSPADMKITRTVGSLAILTIGMIVAALTRNWLFGAAALVLWALDYLIPIVHWVFFGFPEFMAQVAATTGDTAMLTAVTTSMNALMAVVWFWFMTGFISQRSMEQ